MYIVDTSLSPEQAGKEEPMVADPRRMTRAQLRRLGTPRLAYLRCGSVEGQAAYAIHSADGTALAVVETVEVAIELAEAHDMVFVPVH